MYELVVGFIPDTKFPEFSVYWGWGGLVQDLGLAPRTAPRPAKGSFETTLTPNPEVLQILLCNETPRNMFSNVLFKRFQVPEPVALIPFNGPKASNQYCYHYYYYYYYYYYSIILVWYQYVFERAPIPAKLNVDPESLRWQLDPGEDIIVIITVRWENSLHAFWKSKGAVWTEVETGLWDELEDQFVAGVGF